MLFRILATFTPALKMIPFIGSIVSLGSAYVRLKQGDVVGGLLDLIGGVAGLFPGIGTAIMWGLSVVNLLLDFGGGTDEKGKKVPKAAGLFTAIGALLSPLLKILTKIPYIQYVY